MAAGSEEQHGAELHQLRRTIGQQHLGVWRGSGKSLEVRLEMPDALPGMKSRIALSQRNGPCAEAALEETFQVQGTGFFAGQPREVGLDALGAHGHEAQPRCVEIQPGSHAVLSDPASGQCGGREVYGEALARGLPASFPFTASYCRGRSDLTHQAPIDPVAPHKKSRKSRDAPSAVPRPGPPESRRST